VRVVGVCLVALLAGPAWGQGQAELIERRDFQVVRAEGEAPSGSDGELVARLRSGDRVALEAPVGVVDGRVRVELLTSRRLLPGRYQVEVLRRGADQPLLSWDLNYGDAPEAEAAAARQRTWLQRATATVRELSSSLELRAHYHLARMRRAPDGRQSELDTFEQFFQERWRPGLLGARMDMETYRRRLLLPPLPEASEALFALLDALDVRVGAWQKVLETAGDPLPESAEARGRAEGLLSALGLDSAGIGFWQAGSLSELPPSLVPLPPSRVYTDPLGFSLVVPDGFEQAETTRPEDRFRAVGPQNTTILVQVMELPDAATVDDLRASLEVANWESFLSYKRGSVEPLSDGGGVRISFQANAAGLDAEEVTAAAVQVARFAPAERRIYSLIVFHPAGGQAAGLAVAESSFRLGQGQ